VARPWLKLIGTSWAAALVAAAAQLGVAEALGIIRWSGSSDRVRWTEQLAWIAFIFVLCVLAGSLSGRAVSRGLKGGFGRWVTAACMAAVGSAFGVMLAWLPARTAAHPANVDPDLVVAMTAGAGVLVGLVLALVAMAIAPVAAAAKVTAGWAWAAAIFSAIVGLSTNQPHPAPRLGLLDAPTLIPISWWSGPFLLIMVSAAIALGIAGYARWVGVSLVRVLICGGLGPAVIAAAYLVAGPTATTTGEPWLDPYYASLLGVATGLVASAVLAIPVKRGEADRPAVRPAARQPVSPAPVPVSPPPAPPPPVAVPAASAASAASPAPAAKVRATASVPRGQRDQAYTDWITELSKPVPDEPSAATDGGRR
jgi:hypothetical protein